MIRWRSGKAGFVGGSKRILRGFIQRVFTATSAAPTVPQAYFGIRSIINPNGVSVNSTLSIIGQGVEGVITPSEGVLSIVQASGHGVTSQITDVGQGVLSTITAT